jgi:hypothetical protein
MLDSDPLQQNSPSCGNQPAHIRLDTRVDNIDTLANLNWFGYRKRAPRRGHGARFPLPT